MTAIATPTKHRHSDYAGRPLIADTRDIYNELTDMLVESAALGRPAEYPVLTAATIRMVTDRIAAHIAEIDAHGPNIDAVPAFAMLRDLKAAAHALDTVQADVPGYVTPERMDEVLSDGQRAITRAATTAHHQLVTL